MRNGITIIDSDRHVMEPVSMWAEYLPARYRDVVPDVRPMTPPDETIHARLERLGQHALLPTPPVVTVNGKPVLRGLSEVAYIEIGLHAQQRIDELHAAETAEGQIATMDAAGIDIAVLMPTYGVSLVYDDDIDADRSRAYASAYNRWLADMCQHDPSRLVGAALISRHDPACMVADLEVALRAGYRAVVLLPNPVLSRVLGGPEMAPFLSACEADCVPVFLHGNTHGRLRTAGADRFRTHFAQHTCSHPLEAMMGLVALLEGGVFERHPAVRFVWLESGLSWLPYWLWRLDEEYEHMRNELLGAVARRPSEYFRRQCAISFEPDEPLLGSSIDEIGQQCILFGTDFPHIDHDSGVIDKLFQDSAKFGPDRLRAALLDNPARLLGLDLERPLDQQSSR